MGVKKSIDSDLLHSRIDSQMSKILINFVIVTKVKKIELNCEGSALVSKFTARTR